MKRNRIGSNQYRRKLPLRVQFLGWAIFMGAILIILHYTAIGTRLGISITKAWAQETFKTVAYAPTEYIRDAGESAKITIPTPTYMPTDKDIVFQQKHGDILWRIYGLESSFGKEPFLYCTHKGMINTMGYNVLNHQCFNTFIEEVQTVEKWLEAHEGMPLGQELCLYNTGKTTGCNYEENFLSL